MSPGKPDESRMKEVISEAGLKRILSEGRASMRITLNSSEKKKVKFISRPKIPRVSDPKVLSGLAVFLILAGGMIIDPLAGFVCVLLAGFPALSATVKGTRPIRYVAFFLLIIIAALTISKFPEAIRHLKVYQNKTATGEIK